MGSQHVFLKAPAASKKAQLLAPRLRLPNTDIFFHRIRKFCYTLLYRTKSLNLGGLQYNLHYIYSTIMEIIQDEKYPLTLILFYPGIFLNFIGPLSLYDCEYTYVDINYSVI